MSKQHVHFIGIGGIGISALAQWYKSMGWEVTGSDSARSVITDSAKKAGIKVSIAENNSKRITPKTSLVIYSAAVPNNHPERAKARKLKITELRYSEALGELTKLYKTIAICGAHGKSTTTAMTALMLMKADFDPTVIVGTRMKELGNNNFRKGKSEWLVIEADEHKASFLSYQPYAVIANNIDREHLDFYKNFTNIKNTFAKFFANIRDGGLLIRNGDDANLVKLPTKASIKVVDYSTRNSRAVELVKVLKVSGRHNLSNALGVDTLGNLLGISEEIRNIALGAFAGTWRRFEYKGSYKGAKVYDDYAHHPTEIKATLSAAREAFPGLKIWVIHQPHLTARLESLFADFTKSFRQADKVIILETYKVKGRERTREDKNKNAKALSSKIGKNSRYAVSPDEVLKILRAEASRGDMLLFLGAGDINQVAERLVR